jgi:23S rRNA (cytosine1962-C5)-methyltransferase
MLDFIFAEKPSGFNSHQSHPGRLGFVEWLEKTQGKKFYLVSRLDQGTSGVMILPASKETAQIFTELFQQKQISKTYIFLTDKKIAAAEFTSRSYIEKSKDSFVSHQKERPNSETQFQFLKKVGPYFLWEARPITGKSHQIRLHAQDAGISVLGDSEHGGSPFYRLALHCQATEFSFQGQHFSHFAQPPVWREEKPVSRWILEEALQKRNFLLNAAILQKQCYRLVHSESDRFKIDIFGPQAWVYRYDSSPLPPAEEKFWNEVQSELARPLLVKNMINRGQDPHAGEVKTFGDFKEVWIAEESGVRYEFRSKTGQSPGLFLDQRENRLWVKSEASGKKILNLFSYTGGFSLVAALSGATEVTSVDVSKSFLEWTKKNFELNNLSTERFEFWESDVQFFLRAAHKRKRVFDLIVCDPPSFGRSKEGVFKIDKDLAALLDSCIDVLAPSGKILFSTNFEKWSYAETERLLVKVAGARKLTVRPAPGPGFDFELSEEPVLKSFILSR